MASFRSSSSNFAASGQAVFRTMTETDVNLSRSVGFLHNALCNRETIFAHHSQLSEVLSHCVLSSARLTIEEELWALEVAGPCNRQGRHDRPRSHTHAPLLLSTPPVTLAPNTPHPIRSEDMLPARFAQKPSSLVRRVVSP